MTEPPMLDYRKFEENGRMYDSVHRHPDTKPEEWYENTDAEIDAELLGDYHDWIRDARKEATEARDQERVAFYEELSKEVDIDRQEPHDQLLNIKDRMCVAQKARMSERPAAGKRIQRQFDDVRKLYRDVDSSDSDWDEREWEMFAALSSKRQGLVNEVEATESLRSYRLRSVSRPTPSPGAGESDDSSD